MESKRSRRSFRWVRTRAEAHHRALLPAERQRCRAGWSHTGRFANVGIDNEALSSSPKDDPAVAAAIQFLGQEGKPQ
jgi:hypothetical protein